MKIGAAIKKEREFLKISREQFCEQVGISTTYLSLIENDRKFPSKKVFEDIERVLNKPIFILRFKYLEEKDINPVKKEEFKKMQPIIMDLIGTLWD